MFEVDAACMSSEDDDDDCSSTFSKLFEHLELIESRRYIQPINGDGGGGE